MVPGELEQTMKARSEKFQGNTGLAEDSQRAIPSTGIDKSMAHADDSWGAALAQRVPVDKTLASSAFPSCYHALLAPSSDASLYLSALPPV